MASAWNADVVATAKRNLAAASGILDGEGSYTVWDKLLPAERSRHRQPALGLAHGVRLPCLTMPQGATSAGRMC